MYNFMIQDDNPFPVVHVPDAPNVVCCYAYSGAAYANVGDFHIDFLNSYGDVLTSCQNIRNGAKNYTVYSLNGKVVIDA